MAAGKVSARLPSLSALRRGSTTSGPNDELGTNGQEIRELHFASRNVNNAQKNISEQSSRMGRLITESSMSSTTRSSFRDSLRSRGSFKEAKSVKSAKIGDEIPVYIGSSTINIPPVVLSRGSKVDPDAQNQLRKCCLFWTCCCKCSCLNAKHREQIRKESRITQPAENLSLPSLEEVRSWGQSFEQLMASIVGRQVFSEFLMCEYSEENMLFWQACEDLKQEHNPASIEEKARLIYDDYISILSPKEVSLDSKVRDVINASMMNPTKYIFDQAQLQIYTLMKSDSYLRFLTSSHYKSLLELKAQEEQIGTQSSGTLRVSPEKEFETQASRTSRAAPEIELETQTSTRLGEGPEIEETQTSRRLRRDPEIELGTQTSRTSAAAYEKELETQTLIKTEPKIKLAQTSKTVRMESQQELSQHTLKTQTSRILLEREPREEQLIKHTSKTPADPGSFQSSSVETRKRISSESGASEDSKSSLLRSKNLELE